MKSIIHSLYKSVIAAATSAIIFAACKKSDTELATNQNPALSLSDTSSVISAMGTTITNLATPVTFEGYGTQATGGAGQQTVHVTNLNSSGSGSLANAMGSNRTIVFDVAGTISNFSWQGGVSNLTIDGSSAPSPGITLTNNTAEENCLSFDQCSNVIVTNLRVRGSAGNDAVNIIESHDIAFDRLSISGAHDGNLDISEGAYNVTVQRCIIGGGSSDWSGAMLLGYSPTKNLSVHHNLFCVPTTGGVGERIPFIRGTSEQMTDMIVEFRNNLVWKWGRAGGTGSGYASGLDFGGTAMIINNYYYSSSSPGNAVVLDADPTDGIGGQAYISGNTSGNGSSFPSSNHSAWTIPSWATLTNQDACTAAAQVKGQAGCQPLDATDIAFINSITLTGCSGGSTNQSPTANAGADKVITLPTSSVTLTGSGTDPDGSIASYLWTKVSGTGGTIASASSASTNITGLTAGTYVFNLKVTDNKGATASDNVTVTVNNVSSTNQIPTINAGADLSITLPTSIVSLAGSASDPDGSITSYLWTKVSGIGGTITSPNSSATTITGLSTGIYIFSLKATDNKGATATDNVIVTVIALAQSGGNYGTLAFTEGYDAASSVNTVQGKRNSVSTSLYKTGPGSFRSEVRAGDAAVSGGFRSEMPYTGTAENPTEGVVEYDVYYENWSSSFDGGGSSASWNPKTSGASSIVQLQNYGGKFNVVRQVGGTATYQSGTLMTCSPNTWYKLRWEFKWSSGTDGYLRLYINNNLYYSFTGKTADGSGQTFRIGQNRWPNGSGSSMTTTSVCYYDNLKIYKK